MSNFVDDIKLVFRRRDNAHGQLILVNVFVFLAYQLLNLVAFVAQQRGLMPLIDAQLELPASLWRLLVKPWTLFTYFVFHTDIWHLVFNMLFLYWFGQVVNEYLGAKRLWVLYILGGLVGGVAYVLAYNTLPVFSARVDRNSMLGASGAVYAVVVGAATLVPYMRFHLLLLGPVPIVYIAAFYVLYSLISVSGANPGGNIAHLGGALLGYLYITQLRAGRNLGAPLEAVMGWLGDLRNPPPPRLHTTVRNRPRATPAQPDVPAEQEIDLILDKISRTGYDSLSKEEKQKLFKFSQKE